VSQDNYKTTPPTGIAMPLAHAPHPALRRLGVEVQGHVDEYLVRLDIELARRGANAAQRRSAGVSVRNRIMEGLAARIGTGAAAAGGAHLTSADADAVLAQLGPAERIALEQVPQRQIIPRYRGPRRLSRLTLIALLWALMFPVMVALSHVPINVDNPDEPPPQWYSILQIIIIPLGWSALIAPTALGLMAIDQIRKSNGRLGGMSVALAAAAIYPLLAIDWAVFWVCWKVASSLIDQNIIGDALGKLITQVLPTVVCVLGDYFIVARAWMAVSEENTST
jgi:hypothetical protein